LFAVSPSIKLGFSAGLAIAAACLLLVLLAPPDAPAAPAAAHATTATLVATVAGADALDAVPDPAGRTIFFTTDGPDGPAIMRVPSGGGAVHTVLAGRPLVDPTGLAVAADGKRLFVADAGAGRILAVSRDGRGVRSLAGSLGTRPRGLDVQLRGDAQRLVFTGVDPADGAPAVLALGAQGAKHATVLAKGAPLRRPQGVAIAGDGAIYVSDRGLGRRLDGRVFKLAGGQVTPVAQGIRLGDPAGLALTRDGATLLVSSLAPAAGTAQVLLVNTATLATSTFDDVIGANRAAGGLHRGLRTSVMAWADVQRPGRVYRVDP
jgi:DNA-binding beta-propeller fold protein YncE